mmetsp:Transcript_24960/g.59307  ORF Transcript_24960/g.59307 Transcript_24960/m.59307 type:complete len:255 (-) Transcript_24960:23-787(-)
MVEVREPELRTIANSITIAEMMAKSEEGTTLKIFNGILGKNSMTIMLEKQITSIQIISAPSFQWCVTGSSKGCSWDNPMTIARPLQKPSMTGDGSSVMKRESFVTDTKTMRIPASITEGNNSSTPSPLLPVPAGGIKVPMMAAKAPVAPLTMPGRPPKALQMKPTIHAACRAIGGLMLAMNAKATDSGICAKQIVTPRSTSRMTYSVDKPSPYFPRYRSKMLLSPSPRRRAELDIFTPFSCKTKKRGRGARVRL